MIPLLLPTQKLRDVLPTLVPPPDDSTLLENVTALVLPLEPIGEHWLLQWWLATYLVPHYLAIFRRVAEVAERGALLETSNAISKLISYALRVLLFSGEVDLSSRLLNVLSVIATNAKNQNAGSAQAARSQMLFTFAEAYYGRRILDSPDLSKDRLALCRAIVTEFPDAFSPYEKHQISFEETSVCFQEDDWASAKERVVELEHQLLAVICPERLPAASREYNADIAWEDLAPVSHPQSTAIADCLFLRSMIDRVSVGGYSQRALTSSTVAINYCSFFHHALSSALTQSQIFQTSNSLVGTILARSF